jgi:hypothetical protein
MRGDRYGDVIKTWKVTLREGNTLKIIERAQVRLDKSNKLATFELRDCQFV